VGRGIGGDGWQVAFGVLLEGSTRMSNCATLRTELESPLSDLRRSANEGHECTKAVDVVWSVPGSALMATNNPGRFVFFILGLAWMPRTIEPGESWARQHPNITRGIIAGLVVLNVLALIGTLVLKNV
jgi:hypothetical protein